VKRFLQIVGSIAALALGLYLLHWDRLAAGASRIDLASFVLALAAALASIAATGLRWICIVRRIVTVPAIQHWRIYCLGTFFNSFTPANIGGDVYRVAALRPRTEGHAIANLVAAVTVERILGLWSFLFGYLVSFAAYVATSPYGITRLPSLLLYPVAPIAAAVVGIALLPWLQRLHVRLPVVPRLAGLGRRLRNFQLGIRLAITRNLVAPVVLSFVAWALWVTTVAVVASRLELDLPIALLAMLVSLTEIIRLIPVSFQGIGIREGVFSALVGLAGGVPANGFVVAAVAYAALSLALAMSGIIGFLLSLLAPGHVAGPAK
jgi:uncharacterized protein (TIRG00374 family)